MGAGVAFRAMRTVEQWFGEYGESHRNPRNELLHFICVPAIVLTVIGFLWSIPVPAAFTEISPWLNWATIAIGAGHRSTTSACRSRWELARPSGWASSRTSCVSWTRWPGRCGSPASSIFVVAWIGQFVGHAIEGKRPSFFKDLQFLLIGPLWLLGHLYRRLGISY